MNPWQMAQQIKHKLARVTWAGGAGAVVFGSRSVFCYAGTAPSEEELPAGFPFALVTIDNATPDEEDPELLQQVFSVLAVVETTGDPLGEFAVIGSSRADLGRSAGAGIAEVSERVRFAVQDLSGVDGASLLVSASGTGSPAAVGRGRHLAFDQFTVTALCTSQPHYAAPQNLRLANDVFSWAGAHCSARFDFLRFRLGYVTGTVPASSPSAATIVYTGTNLEFGIAAAPGRTYSVWADYDPRGTGSPAASSDGALVGAFLRT